MDEAPHRVDAMLTHLLACGHIQKAKGIVVGEMTNTDKPDQHDPTIGPWPWREIVRDRLGGLGLPLVIDGRKISLHNLRHSHYAALSAAGVPLGEISRRLGHARASTTLDVYGHVLASQDERAVEALSDLGF